MNQPRKYHSKIMLVGEYGVIAGGGALTIPFRPFTAIVRSSRDVPPEKEEEVEISLKYLKELYNYIKELPPGTFHVSPDLTFFSEHLKDYWLDITIPVGYGLGSSGAVSAAVYDLFFPAARRASLSQQLEDLARIESYFHGKSSGMDALTCYADASLEFKENGTIKKVPGNPAQVASGYRFFLLDSGERFDTGPLVEYFLKLMKDSGFASSIRNEYLVINRKLIEALLGKREADPALLIRVLSDYQFTHFRKMIPSKMIDIWIEGQISNEYYLKLNGSGGGFMLGITHENSMQSLEARWNKDLIWIE